MKRFVKTGTLAVTAMLLMGGAAFANDYNSGVVTKTPSEGFTDVEFGSGWYLRGDITYNIDGLNEATGATVVATGLTTDIQANYDDAVGVRVGVGYHVNPNFRVEANLESLFDSELTAFQGTTFGALNTSTGALVNTGGTIEIDADYDAFTLLVGGNLDLGTVGNFTPYVGAAAGIGRVEYNQSTTLVCTPSAPDVSCGPFPAGGPGQEVTTQFSTQDEFWTFAYQFSAGTAYRVSDTTSLDFSYSFTQVGDGDDIDYGDGLAIDQDGFSVHQLRAGVRYDIW